MADAKITALAANTTPAASDILAIVDDPSGTPVTQKVTVQNLLATPITPYAHGNMGATETVSLANGTVHTGTLDAACTITVSGFTNGQYAEIYFEATENGTGGYGITWTGPTMIGDSTPDTTAGAVTSFVFWSSTGDSGIRGAKVGGGGVATDVIWDAAGDLAVGSGANTAAKLAKGAAGANLSTYNGAVAWNGGTAFPASPASGDRYWRSDLHMEFFYNGTRWLSSTLYDSGFDVTFGAMPYNVNNTSWRMTAPWIGQYDVWVETWEGWFFISGGSALSGSHKWVLTLQKQPSVTSMQTYSIDSGSLGAFRSMGQLTVNSLIGTTNFEVEVTAIRTGTPGDIFAGFRLKYRLVAT